MDLDNNSYAEMSTPGSFVTLDYGQPVTFDRVDISISSQGHLATQFDILIGGVDGQRVASGVAGVSASSTIVLQAAVTARQVTLLRKSAPSKILHLREFRPGNFSFSSPFPQ